MTQSEKSPPPPLATPNFNSGTSVELEHPLHVRLLPFWQEVKRVAVHGKPQLEFTRRQVGFEHGGVVAFKRFRRVQAHELLVGQVGKGPRVRADTASGSV
eukprot:CAMPEP_0171641314 /NCGR_PEP_ID=MMETSP0990-20121206/31128_1 /TAXON_ID=483369 /ORGANISM="non described non described, Strain CCMP2098" /LENGTH=99 /DNA_ID=CAMNT_0012216005 /DNA_START=381 /DNA_END=681 /DNA_ORIENTATION=-